MLFDSCGQITLAKNWFGEQTGLKSQPANYTSTSVGGKPKVFMAYINGIIWTVVLWDNQSVVETIQAYGITKVLLGLIDQGHLGHTETSFLMYFSKSLKHPPRTPVGMRAGSTIVMLWLIWMIKKKVI